MIMENSIMNLPDSTAKGILGAMLDACIAYEFGANYNLVLRKALNKSIGTKKKAIQHIISNASDESMEELSLVLVKGII